MTCFPGSQFHLTDGHLREVKMDGLEAANHSSSIRSQAQRAMHACMPALSSGYHAQKMEPHTVGQFFTCQFTSSR